MKQFYDLFQESYIQTFDDTKQGRPGFTKAFPMSDISKHKQWLVEMNRQGAGIYFTPNPCSGGRKAENVTAIRWIYADLDNVSEAETNEKLNNCPIPPHIVVRSGRGFHFYWKVTLNKAQFTDLVAGIIFHFDSDPAISSENEVLRLPPFKHMKDLQNPKNVEILRFDMSLELDAETMLEAYPVPYKSLQTRFSLKDDELVVVKSLSILDVLRRLGVDVKRNIIFEGGKATSAHINENGNYINRFSGKSGSGSTIDAVMTYGNMTKAEAIDWLKDMAGVKQIKAQFVAKKIVEEREDSLDSLVNEVDRKVKIFTWGTKLLDKKITPIQTNHFIILSGNTGAGKTAFAFDVAWKNAKQGKRVLYLSLEMTRKEILVRGARAYAGITKEEWRDRELISESKKAAYKRKMEQLASEDRIVLRGFPKGVSPTVEAIFEVINQINPDLTVVDNFDLIAKDGKVSEYQEQTRIAKALMDKCHDDERPVIVLHHKNPKSVIKGIGGNRGSGKIGDDANIALSCSRSWEENASPEDNARFLVQHEKCRDFGGFDIAEIYFKDGTFVDEYNPKIATTAWTDKI